MLADLIVSALVVSFVAIVVLGHVVLAAAIIQSVGGDPTGGLAALSNAVRHRLSSVVRIQAATFAFR